jgi:colanic acid biosynthesis glycosyl transferase WcaI
MKHRITVLPPWPMDQHIELVAHKDNSFRTEQGWQEKFVVMYSGNHSLVHPLDTILEAAEALKDDPRFVFVFIGGGKGKEVVDARIHDVRVKSSQFEQANNQKSETTQRATRTKNSNSETIAPAIISLPYQPLDQIRYSLSAADLHIVSLGDNMSGIVHPCKIYGALSIGRPVLALGPKESYLSDLIETTDSSTGIPAGVSVNPSSSALHSSSLPQSGAIGWAIEHGNVADCVAALKEAADHTQKERAAMSERAQELATTTFSRKKLMNQFLAQIGLDV